jgi:hypothetical protein
MADMSDPWTTRRTCILVDLENYSALDGQQQHAAQAALAAALTAAAASAGLDRLSWERQPGGDGELAVLPDGQNQVPVVGAFPMALDKELRAAHSDDAPLLRARMSVACGVAPPADLGYSCQAVVDAKRMVDAAEARTALATIEDAYLVLVVSADLFRDVVRLGRSTIESERFLRVSPERSTVDAYITVPGVDPNRLRRELQTDTKTTPTAETKASSSHACSTSGTPIAAGRDVTTGPIYNTPINSPVSTTTFHVGPSHG